MANFFVIKKSGEKVPYDEKRVIRSLNRVGVPKSLHSDVLAKIRERILKKEISTGEIFQIILEFLENKDRRSSIRLNLREAIYELGPTGFPFEQYLAKIFRHRGYKVETDVKMDGDCVTHEIDLVIEKDGYKEIVEAKFHNNHGLKTDVQVALYTYARFLDVKEKNKIDNVWLVTNTKLTLDAITYANCKGISAIAWNYPTSGSLQEMIEEPHMYPITVLPSLSQAEKAKLIEKNIVLCRDLLSKSDKELRETIIHPESIKRAREDASLVCPLPQG